MISVVITAKNEPYLNKTIEDVCANSYYKNEILAEEDDGRGQRAMLNKLVKKAKHEIVMKLDAHCSMGPHFDKIMLEDMDKNIVMAPYLMPLDAEAWTISHHKKMSFYVFDTNLVMQHGPDNPSERVNETMVLQGSCFMVHRDFYFKNNLCDETLGSWGQQGVELGLKAWYNYGKCLTTKKTFYGHLFRHSEKDFPYKRNQADINGTYNEFIKRFKNSDLGWLVEKFNYPCDWSQDTINKLCKPS